MKKRIAALVLALVLMCQLTSGPAQAVENVYFTAINDNMLPLSEESMPFWSNGYLYVDSSIFTMAPNTAGKVLGISVVNHTETAGLGAEAASQGAAGTAFRSQFTGMSGSVSVTKDGGQVDALTGATITSRAVCAGVNAALNAVAKLG